ncbi:MAG: LON peptidase substrate-binding domain-containing protein [Pseudomonadota bacterium]|nr:LON peptidase substrate-binding domain-containing protein [Pseudomonadota bacterium]
MSLSIAENFYYNDIMKNLPNVIPVFPLSGVIYFPKTNLPLNIFEQRYLDLVNDTYENDKLMGMIQSQKKGDQVYNVGCLGKISELQKSEDGRVLINLTGITRFKILQEINNKKLYREFKVDYQSFKLDFNETLGDENTETLMEKAKIFFKRNGLLLNWREFEKLDKAQKINTLAMIAPVTNEEKQKLLESLTIKDKVETLENIINFYLHEANFNNQTVQ